jgi:hypothetical protein
MSDFNENFELLEPILVDGDKTSVITLKKPTVKAMRASFKAPNAFEQNIVLVKECSNLNLIEIDNLSPIDFQRILDYLGNFIALGPTS